MRSKAFNAVSYAYLFLIIFSTALLAPCHAADTESNNPVFARINDTVIHYDEFLAIFRNAVRNKYYHGEVPTDELIAFQRKVGEDIVEQILLKQQADKIGLKPDMEKIKAGLEKYDARYKLNPNWQPRSPEGQKLVLDRLAQKDLLDQIEAKVKTIDQPDTRQVLDYYNKHPEKFTEPRRLWVSVILLPVPPSSATQTWDNARDVGQSLIDRINNGDATFAELAKEFSSHASSINGGDLGYLHQDMLENVAQQAVDKLKINELTPPVRVLEGYTIFQLNGVQKAKLNDFKAVENRARDLLYRELQQNAWKKYINDLKQSADIYVNEELYASAKKD